MISIEKSSKPLTGDVFVPGDKSISHRSIMFGALSEGTTEITGFLKSGDCLSTIECFKQLGILIEHSQRPMNGVPTITVHGKGLHGLSAPSSTLYTRCGIYLVVIVWRLTDSSVQMIIERGLSV